VIDQREASSVEVGERVWPCLAATTPVGDTCGVNVARSEAAASGRAYPHLIPAEVPKMRIRATYVLACACPDVKLFVEDAIRQWLRANYCDPAPDLYITEDCRDYSRRLGCAFSCESSEETLRETFSNVARYYKMTGWTIETPGKHERLMELLTGTKSPGLTAAGTAAPRNCRRS
jgi:hypothetical protein